MARHGENIYKRQDGRYEGRYVTGKTKDGKTRFGYVYARQYAEVRRPSGKAAFAAETDGDLRQTPRYRTMDGMLDENEVLAA